MKRFLFGTAALLVTVALAWAADNYRQSAPGGTVNTFRSTDTAGVHTPHVNIVGTINASTTARATAAAPTYVEGTDNPVSTDLGGSLRVLATVDTTGLATAANQTTGNTALSTINTTLGTPMQATGGTVTANAGTNLNTSALATSANQTNATQKTQIVDGAGAVIASTSNNLNVQCANCSGSGVSTADEATFTAGTSLFVGAGGFFQTTATNNALTNGQQGMWQMTATRAGFVNLRDTAGAAIGISAAPLFTSHASGSIASGAVAAGAYASGAFASGSIASGAIAAGAQVDLLTMRGTKNAGTAAANALLAAGVYNSTPLTLTDTQQASLQFDANGYLKVNTAAGAAAGGTSSNFGSGFPTPGTAAGFTDGTNMVAARVGAIANVAAATNYLGVNPACQYLATPTTVTDTRYQGIQCDVNGFLKVNVASATGLAQGSTTSGQTGSLVMGAVTTAPPTYTTAQTSPLSLGTNGALRQTSVSPYPNTAVPYTATATGTTGATTATLAGAASVTTYICGFSIRANATAAVTGNATVTGVITATMNFTQWTAPAASGLGVTEMIFSPCIPASAANTSIAVVSAAPGTGGVVSVSAWGYKL